MQCQNDNSCIIDVNTRKECPACRYAKCLASGMEQKWVMTLEDLDEREKLRKLKSLINPSIPEMRNFRSQYEIRSSIERVNWRQVARIKSQVEEQEALSKL